MTLDEFFSGFEESRRIFDALEVVVKALGPVEIRVTKSQIAFRGRKAFAWAWIPDRYLGGGHAPLVLSVAFQKRDASPRWKQVVEPAPGQFMHHLEFWTVDEIDAEVCRWLQRAWEVVAADSASDSAPDSAPDSYRENKY